jgi:hypothetical protein
MLRFALHALYYMSLSHTCTFVLDPTEEEPKELQDPAPVEDANPEQE